MTSRISPMLGTLWRGLLSRRTLSAGSLLLLALAIGSALLGPSFQDAVTRSFVVTRLNEAPNSETGISWLHANPAAADRREAASQALAAVEEVSAGPFAPGQVTWETGRFEVAAKGPLGFYGGMAELAAKDGFCAELELVEGACPQAPDEALMLDEDRETTGLKVGDEADFAAYGVVTIVGTYHAPVGESDYWFSPGRLGTRARYVNETTGLVTPYRPGPFLVLPDRFDELEPSQYHVRVDRRLDLSPNYADGAIEQAVDAAKLVAEGEPVASETGTLTPDSVTNLEAVAAGFADQEATARASIAPAVLSLVLVALALLMRLLTAAADLRVPELSLASLRGMSRRQMWALGLSEPFGLLVLALPLGLVTGGVMAWALTRSWLVPGLDVPLPWASLLAALVVVLAAAGVSVLAVGTVLRDSLAAQLGGVRRPVSSHRAVVVLELTLVAAALAILATKLVGGGEPSRPDATDLVLPVLLGAVAGLIATRLAALVARAWTRRRTRSLAAFVSSRAVARRQEGTLVILPITVAVAVGIFALGVSDAAANWRTSVAQTAAPADVVWTSPQGVRQTHDLARRVDPAGDYLVSASTFSAFGGLMAVVDTPRMAGIVDWNPTWTEGLTATDIRTLVGPSRVQPIIEGRRVTITADFEPRVPAGEKREVYVELRLESPEAPVRVYLGPLKPGEQTLSSRVVGCREGCTFSGLNVGRRAGLPVLLDDDLTITSIAMDGVEVPGALDAGWVKAPDFAAEDQAGSVTSDASAIRLVLDSRDNDAVARFSTSGARLSRPVLVGVDAENNLLPGAVDGGYQVQLSADYLPVDPVRTTESVPFLGPEGFLVDYTMLSSDRQLFDTMFSNYVLARGDTPAAMRQALADQGLTVATTRAGEQRSLDQSAYALALRLYLVVAVLVLLMALAGLFVSMAVQLPSRRRDAAALRVVGVPRRTVMGAVAGEFVGVLGAAVLAGIVAGTLAQDVVLRTITLGYVESMATPHLITRVDSGQLAVTVAIAVLLLGLAGWVSSALTVRGARGATLRENAR